MLITAVIGLFSNIVMGKILHSSHNHHHKKHGAENIDHIHEEDVNIRAATLHVLGDLIQSVGVTIAAVVIFIYPE